MKPPELLRMTTENYPTIVTTSYNSVNEPARNSIATSAANRDSGADRFE
jgi:hypothetical protein